MAKTKSGKINRKQRKELLRRNPIMSLLSFKNIEYSNFDNDEFLLLLKENGFLNARWHPSKMALENNFLFLKEPETTLTVSNAEFTSQGKVIMVRNYAFISNTLEIHRILEQGSFGITSQKR